MGSAMGGMMGGGGGGGGGGIQGMPQQNGTEQDMPSQNIMGMQVPDFMGNLHRDMGKDDHGENVFSKADKGGGADVKPSMTSEMSKALSPKTGGDTDSDLQTALAGTQGQINQIGANNFDDDLNKRYPQNYGLNLNGNSNANPYGVSL